MTTNKDKMRELQTLIAELGVVEGIKRYADMYPEDRKRLIKYFQNRLTTHA